MLSDLHQRGSQSSKYTFTLKMSPCLNKKLIFKSPESKKTYSEGGYHVTSYIEMTKHKSMLLNSCVQINKLVNIIQNVAPLALEG